MSAAAPKEAEPQLRRILVKQVNWLGDLVMSLPALRAVRRAHPDARLEVLIKTELATFFDGEKCADEVIAYRLRRGAGGIADRLRIISELRRRRFDAAILFPDSLEAALWVTAAGIPLRVGYIRDGRSWLLTHAVERTAAVLDGHQVHYRLHMLERALGIRGEAGDHVPAVSAVYRARMCQWLAGHRRRAGKLIALAVGAAYGPAKEWPVPRWADLIDLLAERHGGECVLVGGPAERARSEQVAAASRHGVVMAAGQTSVGELVALLSLCDGFVGNDSGAMHVAGALGIPTVGIFGSTSPRRTAPLGPRTRVIYHGIECSPCLARACRFGHYRCLTEITVDEVCAALVDAMEAARRRD